MTQTKNPLYSQDWLKRYADVVETEFAERTKRLEGRPVPALTTGQSLETISKAMELYEVFTPQWLNLATAATNRRQEELEWLQNHQEELKAERESLEIRTLVDFWNTIEKVTALPAREQVFQDMVDAMVVSSYQRELTFANRADVIVDMLNLIFLLQHVYVERNGVEQKSERYDLTDVEQRRKFVYDMFAASRR